MKPIEKDELYEHVSGFLKNKGIELKEGSYTKGIHAGCSLLADAINLSQKGLERAKMEIDKNLERVRQVIHEKTAPNPVKSRATERGRVSTASNTKPNPRNAKSNLRRPRPNVRRPRGKARPVKAKRSKR